MVSLLSGDDGSIGDEGEVDTWVRDQVGLELGQVHVECTVETERCRDGRDNLSNEPIQVCVRGSLNIKIPSTNIIDGLIVHHEGAVGVFQRGVCGEDRVVRLHDGSGDLGCRVDCKFQLGLLSIVHGESFHKERRESRTSPTSKGVKDEESLESGALVSQFPNSVQDQVHNFFSNGVVAASVVVGCIFLSSDKLLRVEKLSVSSGTNLICKTNNSNQ